MTTPTTNDPLVRTVRARLAAGVVSFTFTKITDGQDRPASGTTLLSLIPPAFHPVASGRRPSADVVAYFDLDKMAWRSFRCENLKSIDD